MRIEAKGMAAVLAQFAAMSDEATLSQAVQQLANEAQAVAKAVCPVHTGQLRNSIITERITPKEVHVVVCAEYAIFVEYGTGLLGDPQVEHTDKEKWSYQSPKGEWYTTRGQAPQPFMQPAALALEQSADGILQVLLKRR